MSNVIWVMLEVEHHFHCLITHYYKAINHQTLSQFPKISQTIFTSLSSFRFGSFNAVKWITMLNHKIPIILKLSLIFLPSFAHAKCQCEPQIFNKAKNDAALEFKIIGMVSILAASSLGVCIPLVLRRVRALQPETGLHFLVKAFAAGVILATGFIHILPDAFESFTSSCFGENPWGGFPFAGFISMVAAIVTLMMESMAAGYHRRAQLMKAQPVVGDVGEQEDDNEVTVVVGPEILMERTNLSNRVSNRITSQILELGIVVHSMVIGMTMGATQNPKIVKPLVAALSFHQFFEGIGLGGCISQANFKARSRAIMVLFFSLTTPSGIGIGILIGKKYSGYSPTTLLVEGILNSISAGILIYMALVDLLAADFMNPKLQTRFRLQIGANFALILGASSMSLMAKWANS